MSVCRTIGPLVVEMLRDYKKIYCVQKFRKIKLRMMRIHDKTLHDAASGQDLHCVYKAYWN